METLLEIFWKDLTGGSVGTEQKERVSVWRPRDQRAEMVQALHGERKEGFQRSSGGRTDNPWRICDLGFRRPVSIPSD